MFEEGFGSHGYGVVGHWWYFRRRTGRRRDLWLDGEQSEVSNARVIRHKDFYVEAISALRRQLLYRA